MNKYLADTTVIIEHLRGNKQAKKFLEISSPSLSVVTLAELIQGSRDKRELTHVKKLVNNFPQLYINMNICEKTMQLLADFHLSHGLLFLDALIAATAIENKLILVTENMKHFQFIKDLKIIPQK